MLGWHVGASWFPFQDQTGWAGSLTNATEQMAPQPGQTNSTPARSLRSLP